MNTETTRLLKQIIGALKKHKVKGTREAPLRRDDWWSRGINRGLDLAIGAIEVTLKDGVVPKNLW